MIILMIYCVEPGSHATEEQKQARIAALRDTLAKGQMTQAEYFPSLRCPSVRTPKRLLRTLMLVKADACTLG
jgi:hypothetical protein